jgi:hypothetical protein
MKAFCGTLIAAGLLTFIGAGHAGGPKNEAKGSLTLGDKTYKFTSALAYEVTRSKAKQTVVVLSEKPLDTAKLKQSLAKKGTDEDFFPFDAHIRLRFDDKGGLVQSAIYAEGANILGSGDDNLKANVTVKDGVATGRAGMTKPDTFFKKSYQFDVTYSATLLPAPSAVAEVKPPTVTPAPPVIPKAKKKTKTPPVTPPVDVAKPVQIENEEKFEGTLTKDSPEVMGKASKIHVVKMSPGKTYLIDMESTDFDAYLRILDMANKQLAKDDDSGGGHNARLRFTPPSEGTFKVVATSFGSGQGRYVLKIRVLR